jgi:hypothetical protein
MKWGTSAAGLCSRCEFSGRNKDVTMKNLEIVIHASKEVCLEVKAEKTKYILPVSSTNYITKS